MLDAFIIEQLKKIEQRRQQQTPLQLPVLDDGEEPPNERKEDGDQPKSGVIIIDYGA
jgi:hypothetical protein